jgi:hypothetical protein
MVKGEMMNLKDLITPNQLENRKTLQQIMNRKRRGRKKKVLHMSSNPMAEANKFRDKEQKRKKKARKVSARSWRINNYK